MNKENTQKLLKKYPKLMIQHTLPLTQSAMGFLFQCNDGWYDLIDKTCNEIQFLIDSNPNKYPQIEFTTVKEKFGTLRIYYTPFIAYAEKIIEKAEQLSAITCEECGSMEKVTQTTGWIISLCETCRIEYETRRKKT